MDTTQKSNLKETVFAIIDSRIQFIEYQQNSLLKDYTQTPLAESKSVKEPSIPTDRSLAGRLDIMIEKIELFSKRLKFLLILRSHLSKENATIILNLLTNNQYLDYSPDHLKETLQTIETQENANSVLSLSS